MSHHSRLARMEKARKPRRLVQEFPHAFEGLIPWDALAVARRARTLAGNDVWAIEEHHVNQARHEYDLGRRL